MHSHPYNSMTFHHDAPNTMLGNLLVVGVDPLGRKHLGVTSFAQLDEWAKNSKLFNASIVDGEQHDYHGVLVNNPDPELETVTIRVDPQDVRDFLIDMLRIQIVTAVEEMSNGGGSYDAVITYRKLLAAISRK